MAITEMEKIYENVEAAKLGDYNNGEDREQAARLVSKGEVIAVFNRGVWALWIDPLKEKAVQRIAEIKGESRNNKPMGTTIPSERLVPLIDQEKLPSKYRSILTNADELRERLGSYAFLRVHVKQEATHSLPSKIIDSDGGVIQNWDPTGFYSASHLVQRMEYWGVKYPAITSMNVSGQPEITDPWVGQKFAIKNDIPFIMNDSRDQHVAIGSYPIIALTPEGLRLVREGNIPSHLLKKLIGLPLDITDAKPAKYPQHEFPGELFDNPDFELSNVELRAAILMYFKGISVDHIKDTIFQLKPSRKDGDLAA